MERGKNSPEKGESIAQKMQKHSTEKGKNITLTKKLERGKNSPENGKNGSYEKWIYETRKKNI